MKLISFKCVTVWLTCLCDEIWRDGYKSFVKKIILVGMAQKHTIGDRQFQMVRDLPAKVSEN